MTLLELQQQYPNEWLLVEYDEVDKNFQVKSGRLLGHSANKDDIYRLLGQATGKNVAIEYTGSNDQELTVMFTCQ